ncbi:hypothetical protein P171DRAFT_496207 [Karstenula rhodostoma CBS 690.94]|uniref:Secreted protein n=1 Tax=Karstenula rhodostoma CBS 690.94 TaxID=1392251 RepID=A0A9P4UBA8_9PLEO|nr:hypothetical protein P171DRAFT_496207 [Karstenula rhodostoma CBS 690.94]
MQPIVQSILTVLLFAAYASSHHSHSTRGLPGAVYACNSSNWGGECVWRPLGFKAGEPCLSGEIGNMPAGFTFGSIGPDEFGGCLLYKGTDCDDDKLGYLKWPGTANVVPGVRSMWCWTCKMSDCSDIKDPYELQIHRHKPAPPRPT